MSKLWHPWCVRLLNIESQLFLLRTCQQFANEIAAIRNQGGRIVWVKRGEDPAWCSTLIQMREHDITLGIRTDYMKQFNVHASEWAWVGTKFDAVVDNNNSVEQLYEQLKNLVLTGQPSMATGSYKPLADS